MTRVRRRAVQSGATRGAPQARARCSWPRRALRPSRGRRRRGRRGNPCRPDASEPSRRSAAGSRRLERPRNSSGDGDIYLYKASRERPHTYADTNAHTHKHTYTHTQTLMHTNTQIRIHTHTHAHSISALAPPSRAQAAVKQLGALGSGRASFYSAPTGRGRVKVTCGQSGSKPQACGLARRAASRSVPHRVAAHRGTQ